MKVVLFCGGLGMRMRDGVTSGPKPMALIGDRPLLWHVMRYYAHFGHTDFVLCLGYGASAVKDFFLNYDETRSNDFVLEGGDRQVQLFKTDISDWRITFVDTGLHSPIGERLRRVRRFVEGESMFLANYADVFTNASLPDMITRFVASDAVVSLLAVPPQSSHHVVDIGEDGLITQVTPVRDLRQWENGGYFVLRPEIFDHLNEGEDLVDDALLRLIPLAVPEAADALVALTSVGLLLLAVGGLLATGRLHRRRKAPVPVGDRRPETPEKKDSLAQRLLAEPRLGLAVLVGAVIGIPGASYLTALHHLVAGKYSTATEVIAVFVFVLISFFLIIIPYAFLELRPEATKARLKSAQSWLLGHAQRLIVAVALLLGVYLTVSALVRLS